MSHLIEMWNSVFLLREDEVAATAVLFILTFIVWMLVGHFLNARRIPGAIGGIIVGGLLAIILSAGLYKQIPFGDAAIITLVLLVIVVVGGTFYGSAGANRRQ